MVTRLPSALGTDDLSIAELCAARLDGELHRIGDAWVPIDEPDLPAFRAQVVAKAASRSLVVERMSAAWVHGALHAPPRPAQFCVPMAARIAVISDPTLEVREVRLTPSEIETIGGIRCTTPVRTAFDLLRDMTTMDSVVITVVAAMLQQSNTLDRLVRDRLVSAARLPHKARALSRLDSAVAHAVDVVDGVDAADRVQHAVEVGRVAHLEDESTQREPVVRG